MGRFENDPLGNRELSDQELDRLLKEEWKSPRAPAGLREKLFPPHGGSSWWKKFWSTSIRIPLPVACGLTILLVVAGWRWQLRETGPQDIPKFQPVVELRPRIIKAMKNDAE
jgi:hypothetical protein